MFGRVLGWYIHFWGLLPLTEFCHVQNSLCVQVLRSAILAARHSSSGRQPNFAACDKEGNCGTFAPRLRHLYSTGRPRRWASAHILVGIYNYVADLITQASPRDDNMGALGESASDVIAEPPTSFT